MDRYIEKLAFEELARRRANEILDELEKTAIYERINMTKPGRIARAGGRSLTELAENIQRKIAPRAPEKAKEMTEAIRTMRAVSPEAEKATVLFRPGQPSQAFSRVKLDSELAQLSALERSAARDLIEKEVRMHGSPVGKALLEGTNPLVAGHEMGHLVQPKTMGHMAGEADATHRALEAARKAGVKVDKRQEMLPTYGLATHASTHNPHRSELLPKTMMLSQPAPGEEKMVATLRRLAEHPDETIRNRAMRELYKKQGVAHNPRRLAQAPEDVKRAVRAERKIEERAVGRHLGTRQEKRLRRALNKNLSYWYKEGPKFRQANLPR